MCEAGGEWVAPSLYFLKKNVDVRAPVGQAGGLAGGGNGRSTGPAAITIVRPVLPRMAVPRPVMAPTLTPTLATGATATLETAVVAVTAAAPEAAATLAP